MADGVSITFSEDWLTLNQRLATFGEKVAKQGTTAALKESAAFMKIEAQLHASRSDDVHKLKVKGK